ncbi:MAG: tetratricopeptide repeat protein [Cryobacterium sp.]|nr:tetratricopeptide repeat protein [Cryobacterium sp.]
MPQKIEHPSSDEYYDLGDYHRSVTTSSAEAQLWFDRGLVWSYSFNHEEAVKCFEKAIALDNEFAMAHWGVAYALGPNYNKTWEAFDEVDLKVSVERTYREIALAKRYAEYATDVERMLIDALAVRFRVSTADELSPSFDQDYADAMRKVYEKYPDDLEVATIYAESLMNLTPWKLWDQRTGEPAPGSHAIEIKRVFDKALELEGGDRHPGLLHFYIHLMEMSFTPEVALPIADHLRDLVPDGGHMRHMPSHLDILCGDYRRAIQANTEAIVADEKFRKRAGAMNFYTLYRSHDYHFRIYAAMFVGQSKIALETAAQLEESIPEELLRVQSPPMADWLEGFLAMRVHVLIRFGRWEEILRLPFPKDESLYCTTVAMLHYARGVALASLDRVEEAEAERKLFRAKAAAVPESRTLFNNTCVDILAVASAMLDGELEYRKQNYAEAFEHLRRSIELDDSLPYDEPWGWMQPTRHAYGALLLEQGRVEESAAVYAADLGFDSTLPRAQQHPGNVWALHGYHECLRLLGREAEAKLVEHQLKFALAMADVPVKASCFCRLSAVGESSDCGGEDCSCDDAGSNHHGSHQHQHAGAHAHVDSDAHAHSKHSHLPHD